MTDLTEYDDQALDALRIQVLTEQERRWNRTQMPEQIAAMAQAFIDAGGECEALPDLTQVTPTPLPFEVVTTPEPAPDAAEVETAPADVDDTESAPEEPDAPDGAP